jgi:protein-disulfide isomerase
MVFVLLAAAAVPLTAQGGAPKPSDLCVGGQPGAPVRIEVFSDYQCPACRAFYLETIRPVLADYARDNQVCVIYHDFPLKMHSHAREATRFAVAARRLGNERWLKVSEALYTDQIQWAENGNVAGSVARVLTAEEMARVTKWAAEPAVEQIIEQEIALATQRQILSTPTFFLYANGREQRVVGGISYPILKDYLNRLLK